MSSILPLALPASAVLASPAFWMVHEHTMALPDALQRWGICLALSWAGIGVVRALAFPDPVALHRPTAPGATAPAEEGEAADAP